MAISLKTGKMDKDKDGRLRYRDPKTKRYYYGQDALDHFNRILEDQYHLTRQGARLADRKTGRTTSHEEIIKVFKSTDAYKKIVSLGQEFVAEKKYRATQAATQQKELATTGGATPLKQGGGTSSPSLVKTSPKLEKKDKPEVLVKPDAEVKPEVPDLKLGAQAQGDDTGPKLAATPKKHGPSLSDELTEDFLPEEASGAETDTPEETAETFLTASMNGPVGWKGKGKWEDTKAGRFKATVLAEAKKLGIQNILSNKEPFAQQMRLKISKYQEGLSVEDGGTGEMKTLRPDELLHYIDSRFLSDNVKDREKYKGSDSFKNYDPKWREQDPDMLAKDKDGNPIGPGHPQYKDPTDDAQVVGLDAVLEKQEAEKAVTPAPPPVQTTPPPVQTAPPPVQTTPPPVQQDPQPLPSGADQGGISTMPTDPTTGHGPGTGGGGGTSGGQGYTKAGASSGPTTTHGRTYTLEEYKARLAPFISAKGKHAGTYQKILDQTIRDLEFSFQGQNKQSYTWDEITGHWSSAASALGHPERIGKEGMTWMGIRPTTNYGGFAPAAGGATGPPPPGRGDPVTMKSMFEAAYAPQARQLQATLQHGLEQGIGALSSKGLQASSMTAGLALPYASALSQQTAQLRGQISKEVVEQRHKEYAMDTQSLLEQQRIQMGGALGMIQAGMGGGEKAQAQSVALLEQFKGQGLGQLPQIWGGQRALTNKPV